MTLKITKTAIFLTLTFTILICGCGGPDGGPFDMAILQISGGTLSAIGSVAGTPGYISRELSVRDAPILQVHGKVIDKNGNPVEGVKLYGRYEHGNRHGLNLTTDINGEFIFNRQATDIVITYFRKEGYEYISKVGHPVKLDKYPRSELDYRKDDLLSKASDPVVFELY